MSGTEDLVCRTLGGAGWLTVSVGTFIIAFSWFGLTQTPYYEAAEVYLHNIGYGIAAYASAAIFFAIRAFLKRP